VIACFRNIEPGPFSVLNRLTSVTDPLSGTTSYTYDDLGNMLTLTDPVGNTTTWTYDGLGRVKTEAKTVATGLNANGAPVTTTATRSYQYDLAGELTQSTDADGRVITYQYDAFGRETGEAWEDAGSLQTETLAFVYDALGRMLSASDGHFATAGDPNSITYNSYA